MTPASFAFFSENFRHTFVVAATDGYMIGTLKQARDEQRACAEQAANTGKEAVVLNDVRDSRLLGDGVADGRAAIQATAGASFVKQAEALPQTGWSEK